MVRASPMLAFATATDGMTLMRQVTGPMQPGQIEHLYEEFYETTEEPE